MTRTFEEMCKTRDPLYAELKPIGDFVELKKLDRLSAGGVTSQWQRWYRLQRDQATREIQYYVNNRKRNQGEPYYDAR
jgi:hypothetical protein